ncbi:hypothetical protein KSD_79230 [Ktedonobacter sp. SOSP1-85]|nr:hypothetical protein KSD_79230 [Ktedonobacter sp. SOSP1-85]
MRANGFFQLKKEWLYAQGQAYLRPFQGLPILSTWEKHSFLRKTFAPTRAEADARGELESPGHASEL